MNFEVSGFQSIPQATGATTPEFQKDPKESCCTLCKRRCINLQEIESKHVQALLLQIRETLKISPCQCVPVLHLSALDICQLRPMLPTACAEALANWRKPGVGRTLRTEPRARRRGCESRRWQSHPNKLRFVFSTVPLCLQARQHTTQVRWQRGFQAQLLLQHCSRKCANGKGKA